MDLRIDSKALFLLAVAIVDFFIAITSDLVELGLVNLLRFDEVA